MSCSSPLPPPSPTEQGSIDAAWEILSQSQMDELLTAFDEIVNWSYIRHDRTENRSAHQYESFTNLVMVDSFGAITASSELDSADTLDLSELASTMMPVEVPYLMERFKDDFSYTIQEDTTYWSRPAYEISIRARPGSKEVGMTASYLYDSGSNKLISADLHHSSNTILFGESSRYQLQLRPVGATWMPYRLSAYVTLKLPFGQEQIFGRDVTFYNYTPRSRN